MILPSLLPTFSHFSYTTARLSEITTMTYFIMYLTMDITKCREKNLFVERLSESLETNVFNFILIHFSWVLPCISGLSRILCCMMENTTAHEGASIVRNVETRSCFALNQVWMNSLSVDEYFIGVDNIQSKN